MSSDLFQMAYKNDEEGVRNALANGADPNEAHPRAGTFPVQLACQGNALEALRVLLNGGADADAVFTFSSSVTSKVVTGRTALMYVKGCNTASLLLDAGANVNRVDSMGWSALAHAAHGAHLELVRLLLERGASTNVRPWYDGRHMELVEFLENRCAFLRHNAHQLKQPRANETLNVLIQVKELIVRHVHT